MLKNENSQLFFVLEQAFAYYDSEVVEPSFKGLAHVGHMGEEEEARAKEGSPEQKTFEAVGENKPKETTHTPRHALGGHCHAGSGLDEFCVPHHVEETHADVLLVEETARNEDCTVMKYLIRNSWRSRSLQAVITRWTQDTHRQNEMCERSAQHKPCVSLKSR